MSGTLKEVYNNIERFGGLGQTDFAEGWLAALPVAQGE
jgi:hypothetical protein